MEADADGGGRCERISVRRVESDLPRAEMNALGWKGTFFDRVAKEMSIIFVLDI